MNKNSPLTHELRLIVREVKKESKTYPSHANTELISAIKKRARQQMLKVKNKIERRIGDVICLWKRIRH